jgi:hypothetical protein
MIRTAAVILAFLTAATAFAQPLLFEPDDLLDPRQAGWRPVLISRIVLGGASNMAGDGFRPLGEHTGYVHLATSFYWRSVQFDYKRSEMRAEGGEKGLWGYSRTQRFGPIHNATPKSKDTLNAALYWPMPSGRGIPVMLRTRLTYTRQSVVNELPGAGSIPTVVSSRERTLAVETDTWFRLAGHDVFGSLAFSRTNAPVLESGELINRDETALTYTNRFPAFAFNGARVMIRPTLAVGGISNRGGSVVNLVNPAVEIFRPFVKSGANLHVIYSPQYAADGDEWKTTHQVAVYIEYPLFVKVF